MEFKHIAIMIIILFVVVILIIFIGGAGKEKMVELIETIFRVRY